MQSEQQKQPLTRLAAVTYLRACLRKLLPELPANTRHLAIGALDNTAFLQANAQEVSLPTRPWGWAFRLRMSQGIAADWQLVTDEAKVMQLLSEKDSAGKPRYECESLFAHSQLCQEAAPSSTQP